MNDTASDASRARERIALLADPDSVLEIGAKARSQQPAAADGTLADGLHTAFARIDGCEVVIAAEEASALARSDREVARMKLGRALDFAVVRGLPMLLLLDGPDGQPAAFEHGSGELHGRMADPDRSHDLQRRAAPLVAVVLGPVVGGARHWLAEADLVVASAAQDGLPVDIVASDEAEALERARAALSLLLAGDGAPYAADPAEAADVGDAAAAGGAVSCREAAELLRDPGAVVELAPGDAFSGCLGTVGGWTAVFAAVDGLVSSTDLARLRRTVQLAERTRRPLVLLQDCEGYDPTAHADLDAAARLVAAYRTGSAPRVAVVCGAGHVLGHFAAGARPLGLDFAIAWPWARLATTDPPDYEPASLARVRREDPWLAAGLGLVDDVLTPLETAGVLHRLMAVFGGSDARDGSEDASAGAARVHAP